MMDPFFELSRFADLIKQLPDVTRVNIYTTSDYINGHFEADGDLAITRSGKFTDIYRADGKSFDEVLLKLREEAVKYVQQALHNHNEREQKDMFEVNSLKEIQEELEALVNAS